MKNPRYSNFGHRPKKFGHRWRNFPLWLKFSCSLPNYVTGERNFRSPVIEVIFLQFQHGGFFQFRSTVSENFGHRWSNFDRSWFWYFSPSKSSNSWFLWSRTLGFPWSSRIWVEVDFNLFKLPKMAQNTPKLIQKLVKSMLKTWVCYLGY